MCTLNSHHTVLSSFCQTAFILSLVRSSVLHRMSNFHGSPFFTQHISTLDSTFCYGIVASPNLSLLPLYSQTELVDSLLYYNYLIIFLHVLVYFCINYFFLLGYATATKNPTFQCFFLIVYWLQQLQENCGSDPCIFFIPGVTHIWDMSFSW